MKARASHPTAFLGSARVLAVMSTALWGAACSDDGIQPVAAPAPLVAGGAPTGFPAGPLAETGPVDNVLTEARAQLGKRLFFERRLSRSGEIACASCHDQRHAFADPRQFSIGVDGRSGSRNAQSLTNLAWGVSFFWDGRARSLEEQAGMPIEDPLEMDLSLTTATERLRNDGRYVREFQSAYDSEPSEDTLRKALASFVRTLVSGSTPYDEYLRGDSSALDDAALRGEALFFGKAGCFHCHPPGALTNEGFFNNGTYVEGGDVGRQKITGRTGDLARFKVPGLRNVAVTAPYMHDGSLDTLEDVVDHYDRGGRGHSSTDQQIEPLGLSDDEKQELVAFMRALTDTQFLEDTRFQP
ncbi:MAG TPA: cytochrome c peroxidase [Polyangiaceae bacterium]